jgi:hypothetical protein
MATYTPQSGGLDGAALTYGAVTTDDDFVWTARVILHVVNAGGSPVTVTFDSITACDQGFDHDDAVVVGAGSDALIGPFPQRFADPDNANKVSVNYSGTTSVTAALIGT